MLESSILYPPAPQGYTLYVVGDIHGRLDLLESMHRMIDGDKINFAKTIEIYLGDYIDRGPDSARVTDSLIDRAQSASLIFLRGNHEQILLDFLKGRNCLDEWKAIGAVPTLLSYGLTPYFLSRNPSADAIRQTLKQSISPHHIDFYESTGSYCLIDPYLMVHAGVRPSVAISSQTTHDLLGIREDFLNFKGDFDHIIVHGHTPVIAPDFCRNRINIDTGAFATGRLTCLRIGIDGVRLLGSEPH